MSRLKEQTDESAVALYAGADEQIVLLVVSRCGRVNWSRGRADESFVVLQCNADGQVGRRIDVIRIMTRQSVKPRGTAERASVA